MMNHRHDSNGTMGITESRGASMAEQQPTDGEVHARRIMVVDDHDMTRRQLQQVLQIDPTIRVDTFHDGKAALEALAHANYSILITDLRMPKLDGMGLIREIQSKRPPVTVIVTTGHGSIDE